MLGDGRNNSEVILRPSLNLAAIIRPFILTQIPTSGVMDLTYESYYTPEMTAGNQRISTLGYALLGLIKMHPSTGYELRKVFQETPMARYSSSPGAIYPALRGLESQKLIRYRQSVGKTGHRIQTWSCTVRGRNKLFAWLRCDVTVEEVFRELDIALLRFSYFDLLDDLEWSIAFLEQFRAAARECSQHVETIRKSIAPNQPVHGQLALSNGAQIFAAHAQWATATLVLLRRKREKKP